MKKMKIAILTPTFHHYSGIDRVVEQQAEEYTLNGNKVTVYTLESSIIPKNYEIKIIGMPKNDFFQRIYRLLFFLHKSKIKKYSEELREFDIVISHLYPMNLIASAARKRYNLKYIYYNHGIGYPKLFTNFFEKIYMMSFLKLTNISIKNVDSAISVSNFLRQELKKESGLDSEVIYNKIDSKKFRKNLDGSRIRKLLGVKDSEKMLLFVGRLSPHKNVHGLLKAFKMLESKYKNVKLVIVGKPTFKNYYKKLKRAADNNVIFMDFVDDNELQYYYAACDVYVTCSLWEGFNLPAAEAQACGKPVVAFSICSHPEIVKNGILIEENDYISFANGILSLIENENKKPKGKI